MQVTHFPRWPVMSSLTIGCKGEPVGKGWKRTSCNQPADVQLPIFHLQKGVVFLGGVQHHDLLTDVLIGLWCHFSVKTHLKSQRKNGNHANFARKSDRSETFGLWLWIVLTLHHTSRTLLGGSTGCASRLMTVAPWHLQTVGVSHLDVDRLLEKARWKALGRPGARVWYSLSLYIYIYIYERLWKP